MRARSVEGLRKAWIAAILIGVSGFVDALVYVALYRVFTANMSGNSIALGLAWAEHRGDLAFRRGSAIPAFFAGLLLSRFVVHAMHRSGRRHAAGLMYGLEAALLVAFAALGNGLLASGRLAHASTATFVGLVFLPAFAMGLQNATLAHFGPLTIRTTHVTGTLANFADALASFAFWLRDRTRGRSRRRRRAVLAAAARQKHLREAGLLGLCWCAYVLGAAAGAWMLTGLGLWALLVPVALLAGVVVLDLRFPLEARPWPPSVRAA